MFKRSVNFSPYEKDQLLQLIREYIVIFEDKRLDGVGRREKERAWLELTDRYNSLESVNLRTSKQLQACWKNLKNRARDITEACKKGAEFPFFAVVNKLNSSYLPSAEDADGYGIQVKAERFSETEDGERDESGVSFLSQPYSINTSPAAEASSPHDSPPTVTNYVYSPTASLPSVFVPTTSSPLPSMSSTSSSSVLTTSSKPPSQETVSDLPSNRVDSIAARLSYSIPSYRTPERSLTKSVDRIANSILFERGVAEETHGLFEGRLTDTFTRERNGITEQQPVREGAWDKTIEKSGNVNSLPHKSVHKSGNVPGQTGSRKAGTPNRQSSSSKPKTSSDVSMVGVNGHAHYLPPSRVNKTVRYRRLEHQTRMKNLKFERECLETEHKLRCELLQMKIKFYRKKLETDI